MNNLETKQLVEKIFLTADIRINGKRKGDITVHNDKFYARVVAGGSMALGESYMDGWWDCEDLETFFGKVQKSRLKPPRADVRTAVMYVQAVLANLQTLQRSKRVANIHYNLPSQMYMMFLGPHNQYSSYYYAHTDNDEAAEVERLALVCRKLQLNKQDVVLDIGCGWGGFAEYAAKHYGCKVVGISIAEEQIAYAKKHAKGLPVTFKVCDYRQVTGNFTKIFSGGMLEHVGYKNYRTYMQKIHDLLTDDGIAVIDTLGGIEPVKGPDPWLGKYIFPNSMLPTPAQLSAGFEGLFVLEDWHNFGYDYGRSLSYWDRNFVANWPAIQKLDARFDERFYRMWRYYLAIFGGGLKARELQQWQLVLMKHGQPGGYRYER